MLRLEYYYTTVVAVKGLGKFEGKTKKKQCSSESQGKCLSK